MSLIGKLKNIMTSHDSFQSPNFMPPHDTTRREKRHRSALAFPQRVCIYIYIYIHTYVMYYTTCLHIIGILRAPRGMRAVRES